jgi:hypothetical protein
MRPSTKYPTTQELALFSSVYGIFFRRNFKVRENECQ